MCNLTIFIAGVLDESRLLSAERLEAEFESHGVSLDMDEFTWFRKTNGWPPPVRTTVNLTRERYRGEAS